MTDFSFTIKSKDKHTNARTGIIHTPHGDIQTPAFVPVGTQGSVKSLTPHELDTLGVQLYFVNTYHMYLRPGIEVVKKSGGLHKFMHWDRPLMTDSGGFQVFSLGRSSCHSSCHSRESGNRSSLTRIPNQVGNDIKQLVKITEDGVQFRSHWDGSKHLFTPESSMQWQWDLGADIHIAFDDCTPYPVTEDTARTSMERTHRWALRSLEAHKRLSFPRRRESVLVLEGKTDPRVKPEDDTKNKYQALYGSIQGSVYKNLRQESAKYISSLDFDGLAIGGVAVGESKSQMGDVLSWVTPYLPEDKPRHLLGVGEIDDIFTLVSHGMDTFDCVAPTRLGRMGHLYAKSAKKKQFLIDIQKKVYAADMRKIDSGCNCYTCQHFSRAYIHHLFHVRELLAYRLATIHNVYFIEQLVGSIRNCIASETFLELKREWL
jgi:queuine tRNA-ribosyltransferase